MIGRLVWVNVSNRPLRTLLSILMIAGPGDPDSHTNRVEQRLRRRFPKAPGRSGSRYPL